MAGIFLNYRRSDTADDVQEIHDRLVDEFGEEHVFLDVVDIPLAVRFNDVIASQIEAAAYVLVAIGRDWLTLTDDAGNVRIHQADDPVRFEIETALAFKRPVLPMLIGGARMPRSQDLPKPIRPLVDHNGIAIRTDDHFDSDVSALMEGLSIDRVHAKWVPTAFRIRLVTQHIGLGAAMGTAAAGAVSGLLAFEQQGVPGLLGLALAGAVAGLVGGSLVGALSGLLVRRKAPSLIPSRLRRMGLSWSLALAVIVAVAGYAGVSQGTEVLDNIFDDVEGFEDLVGSLIVALFVFPLVAGTIALGGSLLGAGAIAAYFARGMRLRSQEISRWMSFMVGLIWMLGSCVLFALFIWLAGLVVG